MVIFCSVVLLNSMPVQANSDTYDYGGYNNAMYVVNATDTTLTVDWSDAANDLFNEFKADGRINYKFDYLKLGYAAEPYDMNNVRNNPTITLKPTDRQYTITGLKPNTRYFVSVSYATSYKLKKGGGGNSYHNFQTSGACTTGGEKLTPKLMGTTGTTATIDYRDVLRKLESDLLAKSYSTPYSYTIYAGFADEADGIDKAQKKARSIVGRRINELSQSQGTYTMRGLTPGHSYSACIGLSYYAYDKDRNSKYFFKYIELSKIKASGADDSAKYPEIPPENKYDRRADSGCKGLASSSSVNLNITSTEDSITVSWEKQNSSAMVIKAGQGESKICLAITEEKQYDPVADKAKYGPKYNYGPNAREVKKKVDARQVQVDPSKKSYTFKNLKKGTSYAVVMKCSYKDTNVRCDLTYPFRLGVMTKGGRSRYENEAYVEKQLQSGYTYDSSTLKRDGKNLDLDWTKSLNDYCNQKALTNHYAQISKSSYSRNATRIGYAKLPTSGSIPDITAAYSKALANAKNVDYSALCVESPYTNTRIYGLDPKAKYVFAIIVPVSWYDYGSSNSLSVTFYADETGINYFKAKNTNSKYNGKDISGKGNSNNGKGGSSNSGKGKSGTGNSGNKGGNNNSGSSSSGNSSQSPSNVTPVGQPSALSTDKNDGAFEAVNKQKDNHAWIYCNKKTLSKSKLNKKSQTVTLKIENSKGKIKVSDLTKGKCSKSTDIKIKGRKVKITFRKGSQKGTYKFKVTVGAKGRIKKTTETIKIKVK